VRLSLDLGVVELSEWRPREVPMFLPLDTCRDPVRGKILITTNALSTCALVGARGGKWESKVDWERSSVFIFNNCSQKIV